MIQRRIEWLICLESVPNIALEFIVWFIVKHIRNKANVPLNYSAAIDILAVNYRVQ